MPNQAQVLIGLCNPKSPENVGSVMRAAACYRATEIRYTGKRFDRAAKYNTDTSKSKSKSALSHVNDLITEVPADLSIVCVELVEGATPLPLFEHPLNAFYVFGPEDGSIEQNLISHAQHVVYVPTVGCMNLAASVNVVLYDRLAKSGLKYDDSLIRKSRDVNNRLKLEP